MTHLIKGFAFLLIGFFLFACSGQDANKTAKATIPTDDITVTGIVQNIDFGKDGYKATIKTATKEIYTALISIPNVGGPEHYIQLNRGNKATLKGQLKPKIQKNHLHVTQILAVNAVVAGIVQTITNGKDGYTAQIKSHEGPEYDAVVSIVNMGGPDNYQRFSIGENVVVSGKLFNSNRLIVEKILKAGTGHTQLLIEETSFRGIAPGSDIATHRDYIQKKTMRTGEGTFEVYQIKDFNNNPCGYFSPDPKDAQKVGDITVEAKTAKTVEGIQIGSTFGELRKALPVTVHGSEIEGRTYAQANNLSYRLDAVNATYEIDINKIPASTKITEIIVNRGIQSAAALNDKYSQIVPEEYCWLVNDAVELYGQPARVSRKLGMHYKGETLQVLDSRLINDKMWVKVKFTNSIKTGYEDRFADGQVWPTTGEVLGWIDGGGNPLINCK